MRILLIAVLVVLLLVFVGCLDTYRHAQQVVASVGADPKLIEQAPRNAEETLVAFFQALGWSVTVRWASS